MLARDYQVDHLAALTGVLVVAVPGAVEETGFTEAGCDAAACSAPGAGWALLRGRSE